MSDFLVSARKYRPINFEDVVGQQAITSTLKNSKGLFILEHHKKNNFIQYDNFFEMRRYGDCSFTFFKQKSG